ncbi:hypothetical protein SAMN05443245_1903 [Paraburkholderia fungorum]|uniref:Uncharacterized protein n=1 Tax=Paraburkholderia fungorum TaxID=134537 RepID=A0A1H1C024_9BURK|nr:hypothetical protein [Paraburkholderia fungorum]SDQ57552.1 hypothetical protein SAMN05443245_1903 [Paraburkholderia fungorum]
MIEYLSPAVLTAVLRVSSTPIFSVRLAMASLLTRRDISSRPLRAGIFNATVEEGKHHV